MIKTALLSKCKGYRYRLERIWNPDKGCVLFVMLNPSIADAEVDDPTLKRCIAFADLWGYGGVVLVNLFALRMTDSSNLHRQTNPLEEPGLPGRNDAEILRAAKEAKLIVCAWGQKGGLYRRNQSVRRLLADYDLYCVKMTGEDPWHPLYVKKEAQPEIFQWAED